MLTAPMTVDINLTNRCNLRCDFCSATPFHHTDKHGELTLPELSSLFEQIDDMGVFLVRLAGGEPLVRSDIKEILADAGRRAFDKVVLTNGVFLDDEMVATLVDGGVGSVSISIDGPTAELHDAHRGVAGTFDRVMANLPRLQRAGLPFGAMSTVTAHNCDRMIDIVRFLDGRGFRGVNFILLNYSGMAREGGGHFSTYEQWRDGFLALTRYLATERPRLGVSILPPHEDPVPYELYVPLKEAGELHLLESVWGIPLPRGGAAPRDGIGCAAGKTQMTIFENGDVFGCELMRDFDGWRAGNVRRSTLQEIWDRSPVFQALRGMRKRDLDGACGACSLDICGGGCRASAYNQTFSTRGSDTNCHLHRHEPAKRRLPVIG
jgi:AdoMet-dependent heme synthase